MKITAKVFNTNGTTGIKGNASITIDEAFVITGLKVVEGKNGLFISMPSIKNNKGEYKDTAFPLTKELRQQIQNVVLAEFNGQTADDSDDFPFGD